MHSATWWLSCVTCADFPLSSARSVSGYHLFITLVLSRLVVKTLAQYSPRSPLGVKNSASTADQALTFLCICGTATQRISMKRFRHNQLDRSKECIRLLRFGDQPPPSELDHFVLETYDIATAPHFVALSYTWGEPTPTYDIIINESLLSIGESLWVALRALRSFFRNDVVVPDKSQQCEDDAVTLPKDLLQENGYPLIWIDAICINQSHNLEKSHQVNMMGRIFKAAGCVISWLGEEADNSRSVMRAIRSTMQTNSCSVEAVESMHSFLRRPYWRRMWIIQEFILAEDVIILCGHEGAWWKDLVHFWYDVKFVQDAEGVHEFSKSFSTLSIFPEGLAALISARNDRELNVLMKIEHLSMHELMTTFSYGRCRDRRDRVYALLALIEPEAGIEPLRADYTISAEKLYYRVMGYARQLNYSWDWIRFRIELRGALCSSAWADTEAAKMHEVVSQIVEMKYSHRNPLEYTSAAEQQVCLIKGKMCLAKLLGQPVGGMLCDADWIYHDLIQHFQAFPRGEDPETWRQFDNMFLQWLEILPASDCSFSRNDSSGYELGSDVSREHPRTDPSLASLKMLDFLDECYTTEISASRVLDMSDKSLQDICGAWSFDFDDSNFKFTW